MIVLKYIAIAIVIIIIIFALVWLSERFMEKHGESLVSRYGGEVKKRNVFENIDNTCLIIAFVFFVISVMPDMNTVLFMTIAAVFALRSLRGSITVFRAVWLLIGGFSLGVVFSSRGAGYMEPAVDAVLLLIAIPMLILGYTGKREKSPGKISYE